MEKFSSFITEEVKPYKLLNLIHDTPDDPNKTGDKMVEEAEKLGIDCYQLKVNGGYFTVNVKGNLVAHNFSAEELPPNADSSDKKIEHDKEKDKKDREERKKEFRAKESAKKQVKK